MRRKVTVFILLAVLAGNVWAGDITSLDQSYPWEISQAANLTTDFYVKEAFVQVQYIPEPATICLLVLGGLFLLPRRFRSLKKHA